MLYVSQINFLFVFLVVTHCAIAHPLAAGRLVHGNTLTAAVVIENIKAAKESMNDALCAYDSITSAPSVFLTGPTSKVCAGCTICFCSLPSSSCPACRERCRDAVN